MPGQEDLKAVREMRLHHPDVKIVLISGSFVDLSPREFEALGVDAVLPKPTSPDRLLDTVGRLSMSRAV